MICDEAEIRERIRLGEDSGCELEEIEFAGDGPRRPGRDDLANEIAALANARGGTLLCGVTDDGRVHGMTRTQLAALRGSAVRLSMFEDRLEIQSPGSLPNNLTIESMARWQATRNEVLASMLGRMGVGGIRGSEDRLYFMERRGGGVPIILRETRQLCGRRPEYRLIDDAEALLVIPAAAREPSPATAGIAVQASGKPLPEVDILALYPNGTWERARTDRSGNVAVELHTSHLPMTVYAAAPGYAAHVERHWVPERRPLAIELGELRDGGALIFAEGGGRIPGLAGSFEPVRDTHDRTYAYAWNLSINEGAPQPVHFLLGEPLRLTDSGGATLEVRIPDIVGRSAVVEYRAMHLWQADDP